MTTTTPAAVTAARLDRPGPPRSSGAPVLAIEHLSIAYRTRSGTVHAVRDVSLAIHAGETVGVVGESGSGKSSLAFGVMGHLGPNGEVTSGSIRLHGAELRSLREPALRRLRGARMAMVYQDPQTALNPAIVAGEQVAEARYIHHPGESREAAWQRAVEMLGRVGLPDPERMARRYPHQLSGGQQQRVVIAMALVNDPDLLIMDEPTTGLDVTTEALILDLVNQLKREFNAAILYISHNLGVIAQVCDRVVVMYAGEVVEQAGVVELFRQPRHPYTVGLLGCLPKPGETKHTGNLKPIPGRLPPRLAQANGCVFAARCALARATCRTGVPPLYEVDGDGGHVSRCHFWQEVASLPGSLGAGAAGPAGRPATSDAVLEQVRSIVDGAAQPVRAAPLLEVRDLCRYYGTRDLLARMLEPFTGRKRRVRAVERVSFDIAPGETLALVGESGCGKSTLARTLAGLDRPTAGTIRFMGQEATRTAAERPAALRRQLQMVFQNPDASLNPRHTVGQIVDRPVELFLGLRGEARRRRVMELLLSVGLDPSYYERFPSQLSGGEKQRVSIARAFAGDPRLVICDEAVSALDVSVQATILNLLVKLQRERGTSYLFISHDLSVVQYLADRIGVMYLGRMVEMGRTEDVLRAPQHPYTEALLSAIPVPDPQVRKRPIRLQGPVPSPMARPTGCPFAGRCPRYLGSICDDVPPPVQEADNGHVIVCHLPLDELSRPVTDATT